MKIFGKLTLCKFMWPSTAKSFYYNLDNDNYSPDKKEIICKRQEIKHTKYNSKKYQIMK